MAIDPEQRVLYVADSVSGYKAFNSFFNIYF